MTSHDLARRLLKQPDVKVKTPNPEWGNYKEITGCEYVENYGEGEVDLCINGDTGDK